MLKWMMRGLELSWQEMHEISYRIRERERAGVCISHHFRLSSFHFNISLHLITFALIAVIATTHQRAENSLTTFLILVLVSHNVDYILQFETLFSYAWLSSFYTIWGSSLELRGLSSCETHLLKGFFVQFLLWPYAYVCECACVSINKMCECVSCCLASPSHSFRFNIVSKLVARLNFTEYSFNRIWINYCMPPFYSALLFMPNSMCLKIFISCDSVYCAKNRGWRCRHDAIFAFSPIKLPNKSSIK